MSERKRERKDHELLVITVGQDLYDETLRLLCKENLFPKKSRWLMAEKIAGTAYSYLSMARYANEIVADTPELTLERHNAQRKAAALLRTLSTAFENAQRHYRFNQDEMTNWMHIYNHECKLIDGWINRESRQGNLL